MEEINTIVCQKCLHENDVHLTLCINCGAPCGDYATILPLDRIYAEGHAYREASTNPRSPLILIGMYIIFIPTIIGALSLWLLFDEDSLFVVLGMQVFAIYGILILRKTTKNYLRIKHKDDPSEGQEPKAEKKTFRTFDEIPFEERIKQYSLSDLFDIRDQVDRAAYPDRYQLIQKEIMLRNNGAD